MNWMWIFVPFLVQIVVIGVDEAYFHLRRGLPRWERIGHPLDTLSVLACLCFVLFVPYSATALKGYIGLAAFSCLLVTKDEFVHKHHCPASEQWLHALLFLNHPLVLASVGMMWPIAAGGSAPSWLVTWLTHPQEIAFFLMMQTVAIASFFLYQTIYWNVVWKPKA